MFKSWTFGKRILASFLALIVLAVGTCCLGIYALNRVIDSKDRVIDIDARNVIHVQNMVSMAERGVAEIRGFILSGETKHRDQVKAIFEGLIKSIDAHQDEVSGSESTALLADFRIKLREYLTAFESLAAQRLGDTPMPQIVQIFDTQMRPRRELMLNTLIALATSEERQLAQHEVAATASARDSANLMLVLVAAIVACGVASALLFARYLSRTMGDAVMQLQSSSTELEAAATQQAAGSREQASAATEVSTTIRELLSTSKQIADGAQRVARIADEAGGTARAGEAVVGKAQEGINSIKRQVELVVEHMLELGKKSQQIGSILEIINELSEQTNILAINATIESAGAGDAGKRFAVVADEIRKLADRVGHSTKEIRTLIEEVRAASNTTVMATENGSKSVEAGTRQFGEVAALFKQIASSVLSTSEAAREIELSTKQQATAVEQVNVGIVNVAQTTKETEASTRQTMQTSMQLATLSRQMARMIRQQAD